MSTKIGVITEGAIDYTLLPALLSRIAKVKVGLTWPVASDDLAELFPIRKTGHGGVLEKIRALVEALDTEHFDHHCFVILLDRRTRPVQEKIAKLISGRDRFVLGVAIEEIEAWWLGDRTITLAWAELRDTLPENCRYAAQQYQAEADDHPKRTLDELTRVSDRFDRYYGEGNVEMATEFAENFWKEFAHLDEIGAQCPQGYRPFQREIVNRFRPLLPKKSRKRG